MTKREYLQSMTSTELGAYLSYGHVFCPVDDIRRRECRQLLLDHSSSEYDREKCAQCWACWLNEDYDVRDELANARLIAEYAEKYDCPEEKSWWEEYTRKLEEAAYVSETE